MSDVQTLCDKYNGETLAEIQVQPGEDLNIVLGKINNAVKNILESQSLQNLDLQDITDIEAVNITRNLLDQVFIDRIKELMDCCEQVEQDELEFPSKVLGITVDIDLRELFGIYNSCVPATPLTLRELLSLFASEIATLKKKDFTQDTCAEDCGIVLSAGGSYVECLALPDAEGDFNALDFLDIDNYATYENQ
jgi:hypothetical protein